MTRTQKLLILGLIILLGLPLLPALLGRRGPTSDRAELKRRAEAWFKVLQSVPSGDKQADLGSLASFIERDGPGYTAQELSALLEQFYERSVVRGTFDFNEWFPSTEIAGVEISEDGQEGWVSTTSAFTTVQGQTYFVSQRHRWIKKDAQWCLPAGTLNMFIN